MDGALFFEFPRSWFFSWSNAGIFWQITDFDRIWDRLRIGHSVEYIITYRHVAKSKNWGGGASSNVCIAAAQRGLLIFHNLGGRTPSLPPLLQHAWPIFSRRTPSRMAKQISKWTMFSTLTSRFYRFGTLEEMIFLQSTWYGFGQFSVPSISEGVLE